jgi:hypothetical protein
MRRLSPLGFVAVVAVLLGASFARIVHVSTAGADAIYYGNASVNGPGNQTQASSLKQRDYIDLISDYGCAFDERITFDGATTGGSSVITSATMAFVSTDIGKRIVLTYAGATATGAPYVGTITSLNSGTSVNVTPTTTTTVSAKGLEVHTDDLTCWTNAITDINASVYPAAVIRMIPPLVPTLTSGEAWQVTPFTGRSGISAPLPTITKQVEIIGCGSSAAADDGDYSKAGGCGIAYVGGALWPGGLTTGVLTIAPPVSASGQNLKAVVLKDFWIDCRDGDALGYQGLKGMVLDSMTGPVIDNVFIDDCAAVGMEMGVVGPGNASALGEAKDFTRGTLTNLHFRELDSPTLLDAGAVTAPVTTSSAVTLTTSGQSLTVTANSFLPAPFVWIMTNAGYPVLVSCTGGGGTTTLTGCAINATDNVDTPAIVSGSNVVEAVPGNAASMLGNGDLTANANLCTLNTIIVEQGTTWGPAAIDWRNTDSCLFNNLVVNGGSATATNAINRLTKPGVRLNGSNASVLNSSRNNLFVGGSPGAGGVSVMGLTSTSANLLSAAAANYWFNQQLGNGEPLPNVENFTYFGWNTNGGFTPGLVSAKPLVSPQGLTAATETLINGTAVQVPPQGWQVGTILRWTIHMTKTGAGAAIPGTFKILVNTTGTVAGAGTIATMATTSVGTAVADTGTAEIDLTVTATGASAAGVAHLRFTHGLQTTGWMAVQMQEIDATMVTWNSTTASTAQFVFVDLTSGASVVPTITQASLEVIHP